MSRAHARIRPRALAAVLAAGAALALGACGGSSSGDSSSSGRPSVAARSGSASTREVASDGVRQGSIDTVQKPQRGTGGSEHNDDNPGGADVGKRGAAAAINTPCRLVTKAEAEAILGGPIASPQYAPLGPTCIYHTQDAKSQVTVSIQPMRFATVKPLIHKRTVVHVDGRTGYCGVYGQRALLVPLGRGRVLSVTGPCQSAKLFAAKALARLKSA